MTSLRDLMGVPITCANKEALEAYNKLLLVLISAREDVSPLAQQVLQQDPGHVLVHCLLVTVNEHVFPQTVYSSLSHNRSHFCCQISMVRGQTPVVGNSIPS